MPGTISRMGWTRAAARAGSTASVESWSVTARTRTPRRTASSTSASGASVPSEAVVCVWISTPLTRSMSRAAAGGEDVGEERPRSEPHPALRGVGQVLVRERRPRDVQVHPRRVARELLDEEPGRDRAARAGPRVPEVCHLASEPFPVLLDQGQGPQALARRPAGPEETGLEPLV